MELGRTGGGKRENKGRIKGISDSTCRISASDKSARGIIARVFRREEERKKFVYVWMARFSESSKAPWEWPEESVLGVGRDCFFVGQKMMNGRCGEGIRKLTGSR